MNTPHFDLGGKKDPLHFLHANGYPPDCYMPLLQLLQKQFHVSGMLLRPLWPDAKMEEVRDWRLFSADMNHFLSEASTRPVIAVGHSIGGVVSLRAALHEPNRFRALILLDPVLFVPSFLLMWKILHALGLGSRVHPRISGSLKRRKTFDDLGPLFRGYRSRDVFKYMNDESLKAYIDGITRPGADGGFELVFSPEWESHIYLTGMRDFDLWRGLPGLEVPTLIIRGAESDTFREDAAILVKRKNPQIRIESLERSTHLLPLERPQEVFDIMQSFLKENL